MRIRLWWIGERPSDGDLMHLVGSHLARQFDAEIQNGVPDSRPSNTFDERRKQHSSRALLEWVLAERPPDADRVLALTDVDLFMPVLTFVFGEAQLGGNAAVVSTARLQDQLTASAPKLLTARVLKECVHELGHTFGLVHCDSPQCAMARSGNTAAVDAKRLTLCPECEGKYRMQRVPDAPVIPSVQRVLVRHVPGAHGPQPPDGQERELQERPEPMEPPEPPGKTL